MATVWIENRNHQSESKGESQSNEEVLTVFPYSIPKAGDFGGYNPSSPKIIDVWTDYCDSANVSVQFHVHHKRPVDLSSNIVKTLPTRWRIKDLFI